MNSFFTIFFKKKNISGYVIQVGYNATDVFIPGVGRRYIEGELSVICCHIRDSKVLDCSECMDRLILVGKL